MERRIVVEGREILYELTAKKVKNLNLRVRPDGRVAVSVPRRLSPEAADRFVLSRDPWLLRALDRAAARRDALPEAALPRLWGEPLDIVRRPGSPAGAALAEGRLLLTLRIRRRNPPCSAAGSRSRRRPNSPPGWRPFIPWPRPRGWRVPSSGCGG